MQGNIYYCKVKVNNSTELMSTLDITATLSRNLYLQQSMGQCKQAGVLISYNDWVRVPSFPELLTYSLIIFQHSCAKTILKRLYIHGDSRKQNQSLKNETNKKHRMVRSTISVGVVNVNKFELLVVFSGGTSQKSLLRYF